MNYLTHYYPENELPFQNLSALSKEDALTIIGRFDTEKALVYRRFRDPEKYLQDRMETEAWVREEFIKKGGRPKTDYPHYLVLGQSSYIFDGYNRCCKKIEIPIESINLSEVSFTYPDSMVSKWLATNRDERYFRPEYHGKVFTYDEIRKLLETVQYSDRVWSEDNSRAYDFFIEAQLWSGRPIS